ncbi:hypothetical protein ACU4HD_19690 [Cupriavidus basilensis]
MHTFPEDTEALGVLASRDDRTKLEQTEVDGKPTVIVHKSYASKHLLMIEKFVRDIDRVCQNESLEGGDCSGEVKTITQLCSKYFHLLNDWLQQWSSLFCYSSRIEAFYEVCKDLGMIGGDPFWFDNPDDVANADGMRYIDLFAMLINKIGVRCQTREFKERERLRLLNAEKNKQNVLELEEAMFSEDTGRSRWLILSLTLRYKPEFRDEITTEAIQQHRDRFFAARRFNKLMSGIKNYVWTIEQGEGTGLHLHVILFYSAEHNHDEFIAQQIGEYWVEAVTEGKGDYWNSNAAWLKTVYAKRGHGVGVGQINWNDTGKRNALRKNLTYLAKAEQYVMVKETENIRTFDMGRMPKKRKAGRPRSDSGMRVSENDDIAHVVSVFDAD